MNKYKYLKKTIEVYEVTDSHTKAKFELAVTNERGKTLFEIDSRGAMLSDSISECITLLKELVAVDCYNSTVREGENPGKVIVTKNVDAKLTKRKAQNSSFIPDKGECA